MESAQYRILSTDGYRLSEIIKAMFGKDIDIEINVSKVKQQDVDFIHGINPETKFKEHTAHIGGEQFLINIESEDNIPF